MPFDKFLLLGHYKHMPKETPYCGHHYQIEKLGLPHCLHVLCCKDQFIGRWISPTFPMNWHLQHQLIFLNTNSFTFFSCKFVHIILMKPLTSIWHGESCMNFNVRHEPCKFSMTKKTSKKFGIAIWNIEHDDLYLKTIPLYYV